MYYFTESSEYPNGEYVALIPLLQVERLRFKDLSMLMH